MRAWAEDINFRRPLRLITEETKKLKAQLDAKRQRRERLQRLLDNPDFTAWLSEDVTELQRNLRAKLFSPATTGLQNDLCKHLIAILETFRLASVKNTLARAEAEMERLAKSLKGEEKC